MKNHVMRARLSSHLPGVLAMAVATILGAPAWAANAPGEKKLTQEELAFFEKKIRPVLSENCYKCHSADSEKIKGGLTLDTREGIRMGGDSGHAVVPGDAKNSLLLKAIRGEDPDLQMPPKKSGAKLSDEVIADFAKWITMGAPDPREGKAVAHKGMDLEKGKAYWAFQPPQKAPAPAVKDKGWAKGEIDRFVQAEREAKGLKPVAEAENAVLVRRLYFDLIGLPPTPEQVEAFVKDSSPKAYEALVDTLLASPQYGERWGRHWLDVARYAESSGKEINIAYPHAWRYRDYVIAAFNQDKPYNQFIKEQIAGDLIPAKDDQEFAEHLIATGYLALGPKSHNSRDRRQFNLDVADEQIDAISQGMQGMTVACARCHDHKFDPISQADYYALQAVFAATDSTMTRLRPRRRNWRRSRR
jgi:cytochrome c553